MGGPGVRLGERGRARHVRAGGQGHDAAARQRRIAEATVFVHPECGQLRWGVARGQEQFRDLQEVLRQRVNRGLVRGRRGRIRQGRVSAGRHGRRHQLGRKVVGRAGQRLGDALQLRGGAIFGEDVKHQEVLARSRFRLVRRRGRARVGEALHRVQLQTPVFPLVDLPRRGPLAREQGQAAELRHARPGRHIGDQLVRQGGLQPGVCEPLFSAGGVCGRGLFEPGMDALAGRVLVHRRLPAAGPEVSGELGAEVARRVGLGVFELQALDRCGGLGGVGVFGFWGGRVIFHALDALVTPVQPRGRRGVEKGGVAEADVLGQRKRHGEQHGAPMGGRGGQRRVALFEFVAPVAAVAV